MVLFGRPCAYAAHLVAHDDVVAVGAELVEGEDVEPGAFVARGVQGDSHRILLQASRKTFVHCQVLVRLQMQQLEIKIRVSKKKS